MSNVLDTWAVIWTDDKAEYRGKKVSDLVNALNFLEETYIPRPFYIINLEDKGEETSLKYEFKWDLADEYEVLDLLEKTKFE